MTTWIALLRGVNVGGNRLPMADLRDECASMGLENVRTYIQSGNVVFEAGPESACDLAAALPPRIERRFGFRPRILVLSVDDLRRAMSANPYAEAESEPKTVHLYFLAERPDAVDTDGLDELRADTECWHLEGRVFYLHTPDGYGTSKLAARAEKLLGVDATARNWRTVRKLRELAEG